MNRIIIIRYSEIHLKGNNRWFFEKALAVNLQAAVKSFGCKPEKTGGRYLIRDYPLEEEGQVVEAVRSVFGVHSLSVGFEIRTYESCDSDDQLKTIAEAVGEVAPISGSFRVECKRADKRFPMTSPQIAAQIGGRLLDANPNLRVDLHNPEHMVYIDIRDTGNTLVYSSVINAVNGMPVGTGGKGLVLLSGGIDSPVAAYMMAKRGMLLGALHFHSFPYTSNKAKEKVLELAKIVNKYALHLRVHIISVTEIQEEIHKKCPEEMMITLLRRFMIRIACIVARKFECQALITGESLGQVASQTVESITVTNACADIPVLRPLIGFDKDQIVDIAKQIGTFDTSIQPYEDCCTVFLPKNPLTKPRIEILKKAEALLDIDGLVERAVATLETVNIRDFLQRT